ncbi:MAG: M1 family metallopeptidase [Acidobacteria bacterium]|nr:M1 family metallopeptidase [Acidobacteriota bacterium]
MRIIPRLVLVSFLVLVFVLDARADTYPRQAGVDALHYVFRLTLLTGDTNNIAGEASVTVRFTSAGIRQVSLDLTSAANGKGMSVSSVTLAAAPIRFAHEGNRLTMTLPAPSIAGDEASFTITYGGIPSEGLRLIDNMHGERTAFSENWPDRARQWLPMIDHPYDKATGEFIVTTAAGFQVIANGLLQEELDLPHGLRRTHWKQSVPISSWLYALGVARFAAHHYGHAKGVPLQVWVFPQDREKGYRLFESTGRRALEFFAEQIGPYSYEKLGHVQAAGLSGGTEHASVIFYGEKGVAAGRAPVVHEVAHQWWGNAVTERDWDDVWLSEGFATYFTLLYTEQFEGRDAFVAGLTRSRDLILQLEEKMPDTPIVHRNLSDMRRVLNQFVYQKGGWTLHMLRGVIGTEAFWTGIREYYRRYRDQNATTDELRRVMEAASGKDLRPLFTQWLTRSGVPRLIGTWQYDASAKQVRVELAQAQSGEPYTIALEIAMRFRGSSATRLERIALTERLTRVTFTADSEPSTVVLDPNTWVLMAPPDFGRKQ